MVTDFEALDHFFVQLKTDEDALLVLADELYEHYDGGVKGVKVEWLRWSDVEELYRSSRQNVSRLGSWR